MKRYENIAPSLRFKKCRGDEQFPAWTKKRLESVVDFKKGKGYSKKDLVKRGSPIFLYGRMYTNYQFEVNEVDTFAIEKPDSVLSRGNEVVVPASGETAEDIARASAVLRDGMILGGDLNVMTPLNEEELSPSFLALTLSNGSVRDTIASRAQGKTIVHIHNSDLEDLLVAFPALKEQQKMETFFRALDVLIDERGKAVGKLEDLKKAMLIRMFPQGDAKVPEVRFKIVSATGGRGSERTWTKQRLGDAFNMNLSTNTLARDALANVGSIKNIHYGDILIKFPTVLSAGVDDIPFVADGDFKVNSKNRLCDGDVIMADTAEDETAGKVVEIRDIGKKSVVAGLHTIALRPLIEFGEGYLGYYMNSSSYHDQLLKLLQGSKVLSIGKNALEETQIAYPSLAEQRKIGAFFRTLDALIAARREEVEKLQCLKKAFLERMFP